MSKNQKLDYFLYSGEKVVDRHTSHFDKSLAKRLPNLLAQIDSHSRKYIEHEFHFDEPVGKCAVVRTDENSEIIFAKRVGRSGLSRFVKNAEPIDSNKITIVLKKASQPKTYILITAFIGEITEPEPFSPTATKKSKDFWSKHAFVWGMKEVEEDNRITHLYHAKP